ncbi:MAG: GIY-YIG nuclease family protein [Polaromonas sp.]|nr:GIY-YIG nuclease family protein [Polaromonas sp.]
MKPFFVYLLRCADGSYYGGHTDDMGARLRQHDAAETGYTSTRKPLELAWQAEFETRAQAIAFEQQIKGWSRAKKEALIRGDWDGIKLLATSASVPGTASPVHARTDPARSEHLPVQTDPLPVRVEPLPVWVEPLPVRTEPVEVLAPSFQKH